MLYYLGKILLGKFPASRLLVYVSSRTIFAGLTSLILAVFLGWPVIKFLYKHGVRDNPRDYMNYTHSKAGTPTMGGIIILFASGISALLWCDLTNKFVYILFLAMLWFSFLGALDDVVKIRIGGGIRRWVKLFSQFAFGILASLVILSPGLSPLPKEMLLKFYFPFVKNPLLTLPPLIYALGITVYYAFVTNAVNLTDGLDGLAIVPSLMVIGLFGIFAYVLGNVKISAYLLFPFIPGSHEVAIFSAAVVGAGIGFLWFNSYPAQIFLGDTGSLLLGGIMATQAVLLKQELLFFIVGGVFVAELLSTFVQDYIGIKRLKRRIIYRAPLHHSFQHMGWGETKIVIRFWIISFLLFLIALSSLKIR